MNEIIIGVVCTIVGYVTKSVTANKKIDLKSKALDIDRESLMIKVAQDSTQAITEFTAVLGNINRVCPLNGNRKQGV